MEIKPLSQTPFDEIFEAWQDAFNDYERSWDKTQLQKMLHRRGHSPALSFGAFDGHKLVSFTLNGIGTYKNQKTAYDTGTGTIQQYRGKGLVAGIFNYSLPWLKKEGITQYLLEVLQHNAKAISIYSGIGFKITREFNYFVQDNAAIKHHSKPLATKYSIRQTDINREQMAAMCDFAPAWQNSSDALQRNPDDFIIIGIFAHNTLAGYGIIEPETGDISQLAVDKQHRGMGIASVILKELLTCNKHSSIKIINAETGHTGFTDFLTKHGISISGMQYEMIKNLD